MILVIHFIAGDVNRDGYYDFIVGGSSTEKAYIYLGGQLMDNVTAIIMTGEAANNIFAYQTQQQEM